MIYLKKKKKTHLYPPAENDLEWEGRPSFVPFQSGWRQKKAGPTLGCAAAVLLVNDERFEFPL